MRFRCFLALAVVVVATCKADAGPFQRARWSRQTVTTVVAATTIPVPTPTSAPTAAEGDGLDEVNARRARSGLPPFVRDPLLTTAARAAAAFRAAHGLFGHTANDFAFVPAGATAASAGCAAYPAGYGWLSCCTYDGYTFAGAAWVTGADGRRYMHLFVR